MNDQHNDKRSIDAELSAVNAALALASDYLRIFCVDINTDSFVEYEVLQQGAVLSVIRTGDRYFEQVQRFSASQVVEIDRELIYTVFHKERILGAIDALGVFVLTFRVFINNDPAWVFLKAVYDREDRNRIVIGISNVDYHMHIRSRYEQDDHDTEIYARIASLSGKYICINTVDPVTNFFTEYRALKVDYEGLGLPRRGDDFFLELQQNCHKMIYEEDLPLFRSAFTKEKMISEINRRGMFVLDYRLVFDGEPRYVSMRATMIEENGAPLLLVGLSDIDSQVKQNQEYAYNLSVAKEQASIDALTGVKNKHAFNDSLAQLDQRITEGKANNFAILVFDVNDLKLVNDTKGHQAGDEFLKKACGIICHIFNHSPVFRIGGDEFAVIATGHDYDCIDELSAELADSNKKSQKLEEPVIACGIARYRRENKSIQIFQNADRLMYENKKQLKSQTGSCPR